MKTVEPLIERRMVHFHPPVGLSTLFRPQPKNDGHRPILDVTYQAAKGGIELQFRATEALGIQEQTLLLVLFELAQEQLAAFPTGVVLNSDTSTQLGRELWQKLHKSQNRADGETLCFSTTWYELSRRCGHNTGGSNQVMREKQLKRLCEVVVWESQWNADGKKMQSQSFLVAWLVGDDERIHLTLNCRLASALLGQPYAQVSMAERLSLGRDIAKAIHAFLSTTLSQGHSFRIGVGTLAERLWPADGVTVPAGTVRRRNKDVRDALNAVGLLDGWMVDWERADLAKVIRNRATVRIPTTHHRRNANTSTAYGEQQIPVNNNKNNDLRPFDASGLFFNKGKTPE